MTFIENLADKLSSMGVRTAYGEPLDVDGRTLIPVAAVWTGFGGGSSEQHGTEGHGGGGGSIVWPLGVYLKDPQTGVVAFKPNTVSLLAVATPAIWATGVALRGVIKTLRRR